MGTIYLSPYIVFCSSYDADDKAVYLILQKEAIININYANVKEYDRNFTAQYLRTLNLFDEIDTIAKTMTLEINNSIRFPVKLIRVYDVNNKSIMKLMNFEKINIPNLLDYDVERTFERLKRQQNRFSTHITYEKIVALTENNKHFKNALDMYYSSFSVANQNIGFVLLITALESLLGLTTYSDIERCEKCGQPRYQIRKTVSENAGLLLMDEDGSLTKRIKELYDKRSKFIHNGSQNITNQEEQELQEYVRKVLIVYWSISLSKDTFDHKEIIAEIQSEKYSNNLLYKNFLIITDNASFEERKSQALAESLKTIIEKSEPD